jgi:hypothetical protein
MAGISTGSGFSAESTQTQESQRAGFGFAYVERVLERNLANRAGTVNP